jgi:predicted dehydrogenase
MSQLTRRNFLKNTLATAATITIAGTKSSGRVLGANDTIRIGVAGINGRGGAHVGAFLRMEGVQITYLIDPDIRTFHAKTRGFGGFGGFGGPGGPDGPGGFGGPGGPDGPGGPGRPETPERPGRPARPAKSKFDQVKEKWGTAPQTVQDIRKALDDKNLDVITIATPNHWHALMTIWACQAGKDVYVEKPCSHNVHEGRVAVEMARRYNRIVQHGTQSRSSSQWAKIAEIVKSGKYGKLLVSRALCYKPRGSIGTKPNSTPPSEVDFNLWLGPAAERPFHTNLVHYNWHWFWDFGCGDIGNQGVHEMDKARWMIPGATLPRSVVSLGGRFGYTDQGETPNTQIALMDFGETQLIFEVRGLKTDAYQGEKIGNILYLEGGMIARGKFYAKGSDKGEPLPGVVWPEPRQPGAGRPAGPREPGAGGPAGPRQPGAGGPGFRDPSNNHFGNFIAAVRSRKTSDLNADILEGHYSAALCHLANISYRLGEPVHFNTMAKAFGDNKEAYETLARMDEHLTKGNGLKLDGLAYRLGRKLTVDAKGESFVGDLEANQLLTRPYRKPFVASELETPLTISSR